MTTSTDEVQLLMFPLKHINAKNMIELGVYTSYCLLNTTLDHLANGKVHFLAFLEVPVVLFMFDGFSYTKTF